MKFCFGNLQESHGSAIEAKDIVHAIKIFKVSELFPERCVDHSFYAKNSEGYLDKEYDSVLNRYHYNFNVADPEIFIYTEEESNEWKKVGSVHLQECINVNFGDFTPQKNLLNAPDFEKFDSEDTPKETLPVINNAHTVSMINSKLELRQKHDEIARRKAELEAMVRSANEAMNVLKEELRQKQKMVYIIETYLGLHEEVIQIAEGDPAPEGSPLFLFQQKLYMDEEVGIWDDADGQGIDCNNIEEFDNWIIKHYENFAYQPMSIVAWQIRRKDKNYGDDTIANAQYNHWNKATYFLIRNGSRIYRIWSNIRISDRLFPTKDEYMKLIEEEKGWGEDRVKDTLQKKHENYLYGLIAIQGIIERTDILGTSLRNNKVNLMSLRDNFDEYVRFIRDDEPEYWISDGRPRWREFLSNNRETIRLGSRVCISTEKNYFRFHGQDEDQWRCAPYHPSCTPHREFCYIVEAFRGESKETYFPRGSEILIRYKPGDTIWDPVKLESRDRQRRVPWYLYSDEVLNFDAITLEEVDYYMKNRLDRMDYIRMLPTLHWVRHIKKEEKKLESEFIKMIAGQLGWELNKENEHKIQEAITWWKLKNKWKRALSVEESTAIRMIIQRLKKWYRTEFYCYPCYKLVY